MQGDKKGSFWRILYKNKIYYRLKIYNKILDFKSRIYFYFL